MITVSDVLDFLDGTACRGVVNHDAHWFTMSYDGISRIGVAKCGGNIRGAEPYFPVNFQCPDASELRMFKY